MNINQIINENQTINYEALNKLCFLLTDNPHHDFEHLFQGQIELYRKVLNHFLQVHKDQIIEDITRIECQKENKVYPNHYKIMLYYLNQQLVKGLDLEKIVWTMLDSDNPVSSTSEDGLLEILKQKEPLHPEMLEDIYEKCTRKQTYYEEKEQITCHFPYDFRYYFLKRDDVRPNLTNRIIASYKEEELDSLIKQLQFDFREDAKEQNILFNQKEKETDIWSKIYNNPTLCKEYRILSTLKTKQRRIKEVRKNVKDLIKTMYYK